MVKAMVSVNDRKMEKENVAPESEVLRFKLVTPL